MNEYNRLAIEVIRELGAGRERVALAQDTAEFWSALKFHSDRYCELVKWGLDADGRACLDSAIRIELGRGK